MPGTDKEAVKAEQLRMAQDTQGERLAGQKDFEGTQNSFSQPRVYGQMLSLLWTLLQKLPQLPGKAASQAGVDTACSEN